MRFPEPTTHPSHKQSTQKIQRFKREFSKLIGFLVVALIAVGLVFNAGGVKDVLLELFNKIIGA